MDAQRRLLYSFHSRIRINLEYAILVAGYIGGLLLAPSFGMSWDEAGERTWGIYNLVEVVRLISPDLVPKDFFYFPRLSELNTAYLSHGAWFSVLLVLPEAFFGLQEGKLVYVLRHMLTFSFIFCGLMFLYRLLQLSCKSLVTRWITILVFFSTPRMFAESFYNSKDLVFLSMICISMYMLFKYLDSLDNKTLLRLAIAIGLTGGIRLIGTLLVPIIMLVILIANLKESRRVRIATSHALVFSIGSSAFLIASMPYLWTSPITKLTNLIRFSSKYAGGAELNYYGGKLIDSDRLPWNYLIKWFAITTPLIFVALIVIGLSFFIFRFLKTLFLKQKVTPADLTSLTFLLFCLCCIVFVVFFDSRLFDGWRHFYFVYPVLLYSSCGVLESVFTERRGSRYSKVVATVILIEILISSFWIARTFPLSNLYFNRLAGEQPVLEWEMDYWGLGNIEALEWILQRDSSAPIAIGTFSSTPIDESSKLLTREKSARIIFLPREENPKYLINNFRDIYPRILFQDIDGYRVVKTLKVNKAIYIQIYRRNE